MKLVIVVFFLAVGAFYIQPANWAPFAPHGFKGIASGAAIIFFAYIGFDAVSTAAEETRDAQRDAHLKSPDFFDVEKFPTLAFKSSRISLVRDGELAVDGDLTIRGVTRKVTFKVEGPTPPAKDPWGNTRVAVSATTKINRKDFGLTWNAALETGGILVGDEVTITLDIQFVKA